MSGRDATEAREVRPVVPPGVRTGVGFQEGIVCIARPKPLEQSVVGM